MDDVPDGLRHEDDRFLKRRWRTQRVAWAIWAGVLALAIAGGFGDGPLARIEAHGEGIVVQTARVVRKSAPHALIIDLKATGHPRGAPDAPRGVVEVWVGRSLLDRFDVRAVTPTPAVASVGQTDIAYRFLVEDTSARIVYDLEPRIVGVAELTVGVRPLPHGASLRPARWSTLVLP